MIHSTIEDDDDDDERCTMQNISMNSGQSQSGETQERNEQKPCQPFMRPMIPTSQEGFSRIDKITWLQLFMNSDIDVVNSLLMFSTEKDVSENMLATLVRFVCAIYSPKGICINTIPEMRWYLFCKHMAESDKIPPTYRALRHVLRAHVQARVSGQSTVAHKDLQLDLLHNGYYMEPDGGLKPMTSDALSAYQAILEVGWCKCKTQCSSMRCSCRIKELPCTDL